jgi:hypothetical protein
MKCFSTPAVNAIIFFAVAAGMRTEAAEPVLQERLQPGHQRPFFLPTSERLRIKKLIDTEPWAQAEYRRARQQAEEGDGFWAAFLFALDGDQRWLAPACEYLLRNVGPDAYWVSRYSERLNDPEFFRAGTPHLADVYYGLDYQPLVAYDWAYRGLSQEDRQTIERGIQTLACYRMRAMDRWYQTPNLVFKPTFMVAMAGLALQDDAMLQWGFYRTRPHGRRLGGYFPVLGEMLRDGGPWHEATIYPIAHEDLWCMSVLSRYGCLYDGRDWFSIPAPGGGSPQGLMDYYIDTAYPIERTGHGAGQIRVATYGDGATGPGGDLFLVNPAGAGLNAEKALIAAHRASGTSRYAPFLEMIDGYQADLWERRPLPKETQLPTAPSKIWPDFGLAMLRSDESPDYWTSGRAIAVFHIMSQGYGHDHRDKFAITMHAAGRLLYPDYNAIQYESSAVGWTRHTCSHNTLVVDEQDTTNRQPTGIRHDFTPEAKYLATSASGVFDGVDQTRSLLLTREYLLDVFHATSQVPHTYDYLLHGFGHSRPQSGNYRPAPHAMSRYWVIENKRAQRTDKSWSLDFVYQEAAASRGGNYGPPWYEHTAHVRVSMPGEPDTLVVHGNWGEPYARLVEEKSKGERKLDRLSALMVRRENRAETVFIATHEPYADRQKPRIRAVSKLAITDEAVLVQVDAEDFTDYAAVSFGPQEVRPVHVLSDGKTSIPFRDASSFDFPTASARILSSRSLLPSYRGNPPGCPWSSTSAIQKTAS